MKTPEKSHDIHRLKILLIFINEINFSLQEIKRNRLLSEFAKPIKIEPKLSILQNYKICLRIY